MADDVVLPGTNERVAADEVSIGGQNVKVQRIKELGDSTIAAGRATVTTTSAQAIAARENRKRVILLALPENTAAVDVGASGVAAGSGFPLAPGASLTLETTAAIHADAASGSQVLAYVEEYS